MALKLRAVPFGREASRALRDEIAEAQGDDPLAPVTVVVPRNITGLGLRRVLASGDLGPAPSSGRTGVVNVRFTTLPHLVEEIAGPMLAATGRLPATQAVLEAVARSVLTSATHGPLRSASDHPGTARVLVQAYRDLSASCADSRARLATSSARAAAVVELVEEMERRTGAQWVDDGQRVDAAIDILSSAGSAGSPAGRATAYPVLVHLPLTLTARDGRFLAALAGGRPVTVIIGMTGDPAADNTSDGLVTRFSAIDGVVVASADAVRCVPPVGTAVVSAPTADTEVRVVVRELMRRRRAGTRFERMAIVHGGTGPYPRLVREALASAGIPASGVSTRALNATFVGRTLLGLFEMHDRGWRRDDVMAWVAGGPILGRDGRPVPAADWDLITREAGVTSGLDGWRRHLRAFADRQVVRLAEPDGLEGGERQASRSGTRSKRGECTELDAFVAELAERIETIPATWAECAVWAHALLDRYLGSPATRDLWPTDEEEALTAIGAALGNLSVLDRLGIRADRAGIRHALASELGASAPQTSRFGTGVFVGPVTLLAGLDLDTVFVVGMTDGAFPLLDRDDALLPDDERKAAGRDIPLRGGRRDDAHRDYLAALATAPERILSFSRSDQRRRRDQRPARWLLDTMAALEGSGRRLFSGDMEHLGPIDGYDLVPSFTSAIRAEGAPMSVADRDLRSLLVWRDAGKDVLAHYLVAGVPELRSGVAAHRARRTKGFTRFDGRTDRNDVPSAAVTSALAPTSLEIYAACPRRYLMERVLGVDERGRPEDILAIGSVDRGTLVHAILERFIAVQLALPRHQRIQPWVPWSPADHARIDKIAVNVAAEYKERGLVGRRLLWDLDLAAIRRALHRFLEEDDVYRSAGGWVPERVELRFGPGQGEPVTLTLPDGRTVMLKGHIDRVDRSDDGSISVIDYKTGRSSEFDGVGTDPMLRGRKLQLPLYGLAARGRFGDEPVRMAYWFVSEAGGFKLISHELDASLTDRFRGVVTVLVNGIEAGLFPARPGENGTNCRVCSLQAMCPGNRQRAWERVRDAPELAAYVALTEGPQDR